jgi:1,6-anhydro-N-acetylmuramate kinase
MFYFLLSIGEDRPLIAASSPLAAYVDKLLLTHPTRTRAAQNIGAIADVTFL